MFVVPFLLGFLSATPAADKHTCLPWKEMSAELTGEGDTVVRLTPPQLVAMMKRYNSTPPPSDLHPAAAYIAQEDGTAKVLMVLVDKKGCVLDFGALPKRELPGWLGVGS